MNLTLSWDLFILIFFATVITYSLIIGKHDSVKVIIATYIASVGVQGLGNMFGGLAGKSEAILTILHVSIDIPVLSALKILAFVFLVIFLTVKGGIEVEYTKEQGGAVSGIITSAFGFATAGLLLSTLFTYLSGLPLLSPDVAQAAVDVPIIQESKFIQSLVLQQGLWFALPALLLVGVGFLSNE